MKRKGLKQVLAGACAAAMVVSGLTVPQTRQDVQAAGVETTQTPLKVWFDEPVSEGTLKPGGGGQGIANGSAIDRWQQLSLPIGNSYMGANIHGEVGKERISFNQKTLWNGGPGAGHAYTGGNIGTVDYNGQSYSMPDFIKKIQDMFLDSNPANDAEASSMCGKLVGNGGREYGSYQSWGDIYLDFDRKKEEAPVKNYKVVNDTDPAIKYAAGWHPYTPKQNWENGDEHYSQQETSLTLEFTGTGIELIGAKNTEMGGFEAYIDEEKKAEGSMHADSAKEPVSLFKVDGLSYGKHTLRFVTKAEGNRKKTSIDCFRIYEDETVDFKANTNTPNLKISEQWKIYNRAGETDGNSWFGKDELYVDNNHSKATIECKFTGSGFELFGAKSNALGTFEYKVDNGTWKDVNTHAADFARQSLLKVTGLPVQEHTVVFRGKTEKVSLDGLVTFRNATESLKPESETETHTEATNYKRELNMDNAVATVSYDRDHTHYVREHFASYPDNVIAMKLTADKIQGSEDKFRPLTFEVSFPVDQNNNTLYKKDVQYITTANTIEVKGHMVDNGLKMNGRLQIVVPEGKGTVEKVAGKEGTLLVKNATEAQIFVTADTDYKMVYPNYRSGETDEQLAKKVKDRLDAAVAKTYAGVKESAEKDYKNIYDRVKLNIGQTVSDKTTDMLINSYKNNTASATEKLYLETLLFQFGRYLQLGSSREGDKLPANLQGVWSDGTNIVPWHVDYHLNVNFQMNYWPTYSTNMAECGEPMIDFVEGLREPGRKTAEVYFGIKSEPGQANGFTASTQITPFGWTCPGWAFDWGWSPAAMPWVLQNVYDAYEYSGNVDKLATEIFPMMREQAKFYSQILKEKTYEDGSKRYVTVPAYSPEHGPKTAGNTYENSLAWQLFNDCLEAAEVLNKKTPGTVSADEIKQWETFRDGLKPIEVGADNQIKEWYEEDKYLLDANGNRLSGDRHHRHLSHMLGLYPGDLINVENPTYINAAKKSLELRGDDATGWGMAQRLNSWARVGDGNHAHTIIKAFIRGGVYPNLWDAHPPFQIDGNFGYTAGVAEMLMQSNAGYINLIPAIPNEWATGSVSGLVARGNFEVAESWANKALTAATIKSNKGGTCTVQTGWDYTTVTDSKGKAVKATPVAGKPGRVSFPTTAGESYVLGKGTAPAIEKVSVVFKAGTTNVETREVVKGEAIGTLPEAPAKTGFTFKEWNTQEDGKGTKVTDKTVAAAAMTVYAIYDEVVVAPTKYTVTFMNGTEKVSEKTVEEGKPVGTLPAAPTKEGYTFVAWNTEVNGAISAVTENTIVKANMTVYAVFEKNAEIPQPTKYTVTFKNGTETIHEKTVEEGKAIGTLPVEPTKEGYTFKGWNTKADGTGTAVTEKTVVKANMTVYTVYEKKADPTPTPDPEKPVKHTVTFEVGGKTYTLTCGQNATFGKNLPVAPAKEGYTFKCWNTKADGTGDVVTADTKITSDLKLYAVYTKNEAKPPVKPEPEKPSKPSKPAKPNKPAAPTTGDAMTTTTVATTLLVAGLAIAVVLFERKRRAN